MYLKLLNKRFYVMSSIGNGTNHSTLSSRKLMAYHQNQYSKTCDSTHQLPVAQMVERSAWIQALWIQVPSWTRHFLSLKNLHFLDDICSWVMLLPAHSWHFKCLTLQIRISSVPPESVFPVAPVAQRVKHSARIRRLRFQFNSRDTKKNGVCILSNRASDMATYLKIAYS